MKANFVLRSIAAVAVNLSLAIPVSAEENFLTALGCMLEPSKNVEVGSSVSGVIESINLYRGDQVKEGEVLFRLKAGMQKAGVELARLKSEFSQRKLVRNAEMFEDQLLSAHERDEIETESLMAKTELQLKEQELDLRRVMSPISGVVVDRFVDKGEYVNVEPVLSLATLDPLHIDLLLPYSYFGSIVTGQELQIRAEPTLIQPTFVTHIPKELCPLAKITVDDDSTIDVFELCINGQEIAPAYSEQNDPIIQRKMFAAQVGEEVQDMDTDFLNALEHGMPPAGGMGLGIDRLIILLTGAESIRDTILFPSLKPLKSAE